VTRANASDHAFPDQTSPQDVPVKSKLIVSEARQILNEDPAGKLRNGRFWLLLSQVG
jgi:hypothetical protein